MSSSPDIQSLLQQAASAGASGDLPLAECFCQQVLALDPRDADALRLMGMVGWRSGDVDKGERFLRESLAVRPGQPQVLADLGDLLASKHDTEAALGCYAESVRLAPDFAEAWLKLGIARGEEGDIHAAIDALQRSLDLRPGGHARGRGSTRSGFRLHESSHGIAIPRHGAVPGSEHDERPGVCARPSRNDDAPGKVSCFLLRARAVSRPPQGEQMPGRLREALLNVITRPQGYSRGQLVELLDAWWRQALAAPCYPGPNPHPDPLPS